MKEMETERVKEIDIEMERERVKDMEMERGGD